MSGAALIDSMSVCLCVCVRKCDCVCVCVTGWMDMGVIAWAKVGFCGCSSLD